MQNVEVCLSGKWFEAINVSSHNVDGLFFCTIKHSALAVENNLVSVDVLVPQERIREMLTVTHIDSFDTVESGEESGESSEESNIKTLRKNIEQNTTSLWNFGIPYNYAKKYHSYFLNRIFSTCKCKKHWFRHATQALPLDTYDACVHDLLIEPLKELFDDFLIAELISFLVAPLYFEVDFVEACREIFGTERIMRREVLFWSYESHKSASVLLDRIWNALYSLDNKQFNNLKRKDPDVKNNSTT